MRQGGGDAVKHPRVRVSDHAVVRYLERVGGFDIERLRLEIAARAERSLSPGAISIVMDGFRYVVRRDDEGRPVIVTVMDADLNPSSGLRDGSPR